MIRTLLFDDEPLILRTMQTAIERCNPNYRIIGAAPDGKTGLEMVETLHPDVVFTDIRMPVMDGLALVESMRKKGIHTLVVIISGYSDFEYAQRAIGLGVTDYLVKPWKADQLKSVLDKMEKEIRRRRHVSANAILSSAMHAMPGDGERSLWQDLRGDGNFLLMHLCFGPLVSTRITGAVQSHSQSFDKWEYRNLLPVLPGEHWIFPGRYPNEAKIVLRLDHGENPNEAARAYFDMLKEQAEGFFHVTMAVSDPFDDIEGFSSLNTDAETAILKGIRFADSTLITNEADLPDDHPDPNELDAQMALLRDAMNRPRQDVIRKIAEDIFEICSRNAYTQLQLQAVVRRMFRRVPAMQDRDIADIAATLVVSCDNYNELPDAFVSWLDRKGDVFEPESGKAVDDVVEEIRLYIHENIHERLVIQELAAKFGINYTYLSAVFRKRYGTSLNEYINSARIHRAAELMRTRQSWKFKDISEMVGFSDPYYFSRVFKAVLGLSPTQYKKTMEE